MEAKLYYEIFALLVWATLMIVGIFRLNEKDRGSRYFMLAAILANIMWVLK